VNSTVPRYGIGYSLVARTVCSGLETIGGVSLSAAVTPQCLRSQYSGRSRRPVQLSESTRTTDGSIASLFRDPDGFEQRLRFRTACLLSSYGAIQMKNARVSTRLKKYLIAIHFTVLYAGVFGQGILLKHFVTHSNWDDYILLLGLLLVFCATVYGMVSTVYLSWRRGGQRNENSSMT
jgi:hypothetical protein